MSPNARFQYTNCICQNLSDEYEESRRSLPIDQGRTTTEGYVIGKPSLQINSSKFVSGYQWYNHILLLSVYPQLSYAFMTLARSTISTVVLGD